MTDGHMTDGEMCSYKRNRLHDVIKFDN